jgi:hypothetical protein
LFFALLGAIILAGCGSSDTTSRTSYNPGTGDEPYKPVTRLNHRTLATNYYAGQLQVIDATQDRLTTFTFATGAQPTYMQSSPDGTLTLVNNTGAYTLSSLNNTQEKVKGTVQLGGWTESFVTSINNEFGFAAVYNYSNGNLPKVPGAIARFNPTDGSLNTFIPFPNVRYLAMDPAEKHLLAFTDVDDNAHWVDTTTVDVNDLPVVSILSLPSGTFSRPVAAFFSADSTKAYILSCGFECGGSGVTIPLPSNATCPTTISALPACTYPAAVTEIDVTTPTAPTVVNQWGLQGAHSGLIDLTANKLYVAGSSSVSTSYDCPFADLGTPACTTNNGGNSVYDGYFTVVDLAAGPGAPIRIGNGGGSSLGTYGKRVIRNINGVFWVGAQNCGVQSCITMVNPATSPATVTPLAAAKGDATGITLNTNTGEIYTIEGGGLNIYTQKGVTITSQYNTDIKGQAFDVLYID